jgi:hypothetical protein
MQTFFIIIGILGVALLIAYFLTSKSTQGTVDERISKVQDKQSSDLGFLGAKYQGKTAQARADHTKALVTEAEAVFDLNAVPEKKRREEEKEIIALENLKLVTDEANKHKLSPGNYETLKLNEGMAQIKLLEAEGLKNLDWEFLEKEHQLKLRGALILAIKEHRELEGLTEMFEVLVRRKHQIESGEDAPAVKQKLLERYDNNITILDGVINAKGNRLLKEMDGEEP